MFRKLLLAVPAALALIGGPASAQIRQAQPVTVSPPKPIVTLQPQYNFNSPFASPYSQTPVRTPTLDRPVVLPATWTRPAVIPTHLTPWGTIQPAQLIPGVYTPPMIASVEPSRYIPVSPWAAVNPVNGNVYDGWNNSFTNRDGTYQYNPWNNTFVNPFNSATYNPNNGVTLRPLTGVVNSNPYSTPWNTYPVFMR